MTYGVRIWGAKGALELDETSFSVRVIYSGLVSRPTGITYVDIAVPGCDPATCSAVCVPVVPYPADPNSQNLYAIQQEPQVFNGYVRVWIVNRNIQASASPAPALETQRLLVMRYR